MVSELTCKPLWPPGHLYLPVNQKSFCSLCLSVRRSIFSLFTFISTDFHVLLVRVSTQDIRSAYHPLVIVCGKSKNLCFHILFIFFNFNHVNPTIGFSPYCHFSDCPTYHRSSFSLPNAWTHCMGKAFVHPGAHVQPQRIMSHSLDPSFFSSASTTTFSFICVNLKICSHAF